MGEWGIFWQWIGSVVGISGFRFNGFGQMSGYDIRRTTQLASVAFLSTLFRVFFICDGVAFGMAPSFAISAFDDHFSVFVAIWEKKNLKTHFDERKYVVTKHCYKSKFGESLFDGIWSKITNA